MKSLRLLKAAWFACVMFACSGGNETKTEKTVNGQTLTCISGHECINDTCKCTNDGKKDQSCTSDAKCKAECEVCK